MATMTQIREGLATNLASIPNVQVSAYMLAAPTPPAIHVYPSMVAYDAAMGRGLDVVRVTVQAIVGLTSDQGAQKKLDAMLAPTGATASVKAAVESDRTLGGTVQDLRVTEATGYRVYEGARGVVLGCEWTVEVYS